jgi:type VI secretion system protein ImpH
MASSAWRSGRTLKSLRWRHAPARREEADEPDGWDIAQRFRFRADLSAAFPGQEISGLKLARPMPPRRSGRPRSITYANEVIEVRTPDYVVASTIGPLPEPYTDWVRMQEKLREHAMADFLDLFNQRLNVLRFEGKSRQTLGLNTLPPAETPHAHYLAALMGMGRPELAAQVPMPRRAWLALAGLLGKCRKSTPVLAHVLSLYLGEKVTPTEFTGGWQSIEENDRIALGRRNHGLGRTIVLGRRVWDQQARLRLEVAPLDYARFCQLLPPSERERLRIDTNDDSAYFNSFVTLLRILLDRQCDCEVRLSVRAETIPPSAMQSRANEGYRGLRLAQSAWLEGGARNMPRQAAFVVRAWDNAIVPEAA